MNLKYRKAPPGWSHTNANPFKPDGSYGLEWSSFCIVDRDDDVFVTGKSGDGPFSARFGQRVAHLETRLIDFLRYENAQGRTVILSLPAGVDVDCFVAQALSQMPDTDALRADDPEVLVHSTTVAAWEGIRADGQLKAASALPQCTRRLLDPSSALAQYLQNEPPEYDDYIMFGEMATTMSENIVASFQTGNFISGGDAVYKPGVRLYFDNHRIIGDNRATRDGLHIMKVHKQLPLSPYLLAAIGVGYLDPQREIRAWTPRLFVEESDRVFGRPHASRRR